MEPKALDLKDIHLAIGDGKKKRLPSEEKPLLKMSQAVRPIKPIKAGEPFTYQNVGLKTPAVGMPAWKLPEIIGKVSINALSTADILKEEDIGK